MLFLIRSSWADIKTAHVRNVMEEDQVMAMFLQMVLSLHFCHTPMPGRQQVLHRDLKPENGKYLDVSA